MHRKRILGKILRILDKILMVTILILLVIKVHSDLSLDFVTDIYIYCILMNMSIKLFRFIKENNKKTETDSSAEK